MNNIYFLCRNGGRRFPEWTHTPLDETDRMATHTHAPLGWTEWLTAHRRSGQTGIGTENWYVNTG